MKLSIQNVVTHKSLAACLVVLATALLGGCATPTTSQGMTATGIQTTTKHAKSVGVTTAGGQETEATGKAQISNAAFSQALINSINNSKTFSSAVQGKGGDYQLTVTIFNMEQPSFGLSFTVKLEAGWTLTRADTGAVVWQESIKSEHTATTSDAFAAVERLRLATEGAARNNIAQGLTKISSLKL